jgi:hypothetical protein
MAQWYNGTMVQWYNGIMVQWYNGEKVVLTVNFDDQIQNYLI